MRRVFILVFISVLQLLLLTSCEHAPGALITFLDCDGTATLIKTPDSTVLIDTGSSADGEHIGQALDSLGVEAIDLLIISRMDESHVGGAEYILKHYDVRAVCEPCSPVECEEGKKFELLLSSEDILPYAMSADTAFEIDGVEYSLYASHTAQAGDCALAVRARMGESSVMLAQDISAEHYVELIADNYEFDSQLYRLPSSGNSVISLCARTVKPEYAVFSDESQAEVLSGIFGDSTLYSCGSNPVCFVCDGTNIVPVK